MTICRKPAQSIAIATCLLAAAPVASSADGVFEINQACVEAGCFSGDDPGFPVRITQSGSYVLTSNLVLSDLVNAITNQDATGDFTGRVDVTIDLNGFTIRGPTECSGDPLVCDPVGTPGSTGGWGIFLATVESRMSARIINGTIRGMPLAAVSCGSNCIVENLTASENGLAGILVDGVVRDSTASVNGGSGIGLSNEGVVADCVSTGNTGSGFSGNGVFRDNSATKNGEFGIFANPGSRVSGNSIENNSRGVRCNDCLLTGNNILENDNEGVDFESSPAAWGGNLILDNGSSIINAGSVVEIDGNACSPAC